MLDWGPRSRTSNRCLRCHGTIVQVIAPCSASTPRLTRVGTFFFHRIATHHATTAAKKSAAIVTISRTRIRPNDPRRNRHRRGGDGATGSPAGGSLAHSSVSGMFTEMLGGLLSLVWLSSARESRYATHYLER